MEEIEYNIKFDEDFESYFEYRIKNDDNIVDSFIQQKISTLIKM